MAGVLLPGSSKPGSGDITGVTAGDGLSGGGDSGGVTVTLDLNELTAAAVADGDFIPIIDTNDSNGSRKEAVHDLATLFSGTGLTATNSVIAVDASQSQITTVGALDSGSITSGFGAIDNGTSNIRTATFTAGEDLVRGEVVYFKAGDSKMWKAVASAAGTMPVAAMAAADISADATGKFLLFGFLADNGTFPSYTVGADLYAPEAETSSQNVPEEAAPDSTGDFVQVVGYAVTANSVFFNPSNDVIEHA